MSSPGEATVWLAEQGFQIVSLTEERLQETLALMRDSFYTDEPPAKAVQLQTCPEAIDELEALTVDTFRDGTSVVALDQSGRVVGASFNKLQTCSSESAVQDEPSYFETFKNERCKTDVAKEYVDCMIRIDDKVDVFSHYGVTQSLEVMFFCTGRAWRGQGVGRLLIQAAEKVARARGVPLVSAIFTSNASQRIGEKLGWDALARVPMSEQVFRGQSYSLFTGEDTSQLLVARRITD